MTQANEITRPTSPLMAALSAKWDRTVGTLDPAGVPDDPDACVSALMGVEAVLKDINDVLRLARGVREAFGLAAVAKHGRAVHPYYAGTEKTYRVKNPLGLWDALLKASGGVEDVAVGCLASQAFKPGACRELLGDDGFAEQFEVTEAAELRESKGKDAAAKKLIRANVFEK